MAFYDSLPELIKILMSTTSIGIGGESHVTTAELQALSPDSQNKFKIESTNTSRMSLKRGGEGRGKSGSKKTQRLSSTAGLVYRGNVKGEIESQQPIVLKDYDSRPKPIQVIERDKITHIPESIKVTHAPNILSAPKLEFPSSPEIKPVVTQAIDSPYVPAGQARQKVMEQTMSAQLVYSQNEKPISEPRVKNLDVRAERLLPIEVLQDQPQILEEIDLPQPRAQVPVNVVQEPIQEQRLHAPLEVVDVLEEQAAEALQVEDVVLGPVPERIQYVEAEPVGQAVPNPVNEDVVQADPAHQFVQEEPVEQVALQPGDQVVPNPVNEIVAHADPAHSLFRKSLLNRLFFSLLVKLYQTQSMKMWFKLFLLTILFRKDNQSLQPPNLLQFNN
jgi:hypothetical protein